MSNILVKFPTRSRPDKFFETLGMYMDRASGLHQVSYLVSCDLDDFSMNNDETKARLSAIDGLTFRFGNNGSKIAACNADMDIAPAGWQILVLVSDDMIPQVDGWDNRISEEMQGRDAVWFYDGYARKTCTLSIMSRAIYERQGYIYHPDYKSLWCDNEWTDVAEPVFVEQVIIQHQHPLNHKTPVDTLLKYNESFKKQDDKTYKTRKGLGFPGSSGGTDASSMLLSICICSLEPRSYMLSDLTASLYRQIDEAGLCGKVEVLIEVDSGQISIGAKRNLLVQRARGKYVCFVDDDDCVSDRYVELLAAACLEGSDCIGITGRIREGNGWKRWVHSTRFKGCRDDGDEYTRPPNHLNPVKKSILVGFPFKDVNFGEDRDVALRMAKACALRSETTVKDCIYDYYPHGGVHETRTFTPRPQHAKVPKNMHAKIPKNMQKRMDAAAKAAPMRRPVPDCVYLVITTECSRGCPKCAFKYPDVWSANAEYVERVIDTIGHVHRIHVTGGEPLEHPDIAGIVHMLVSKKAAGKFDALTLETAIYHASAVHFNQILFSDYGNNSEAARQLKGLGRPEVVVSQIEHVEDQKGRGGMCSRGLTGNVVVYQERVYPCCASVCVPGVQSIPLDGEWRSKILDVETPCSECRFSVKRGQKL